MSNICLYTPSNSILSASRLNQEFTLIHRSLCYTEAALSTTVLMGAENGLSVSSQNAVLGQDDNDPLAPAKLLSTREIPLNGNSVVFTDVATGTPNIRTGVSIANADLAISGSDINGQAANINFTDSSGSQTTMLKNANKLLISTDGGTVMQIFDNAGEVRLSQISDDVNTGQKLQVIGTSFMGGDNVTNTNNAWLQIGAGTTGTGSINLEAGLLTTTPMNGNFEYDGTHLYFTIVGTRHTII